MQWQLLVLFSPVVIGGRIWDRFVLVWKVGITANVDRNGSWFHQLPRGRQCFTVG